MPKKKTVRIVAKDLSLGKVAGRGALEVKGVIADQNKVPLLGLAVKAFDRNVGVEDLLLGQAVTDAKGLYYISYTV